MNANGRQLQRRILGQGGDIVIYQARDGRTTLDVRLERETLWLSQKQMAQLFDKNPDTIGLHIRNAYKENELAESATAEEYSVVQREGKRDVTRSIRFYNLDVVIAVGYRVNSKRGTEFRIWATQVLREHLLRGYTLNEKRLQNEQALVAFQQHPIRRRYDEQTQTWFFSVVDVIAALTDSANPAVYWRVLKKRLKDEGADESVTKCNALRMPAADGKMRLTDMAATETLFRIIQSIPSPKAEPLKQWLAKVGYERIQDMSDPARSLDRAREYWTKHGRSEKWIQQRMMGQETRNKLTDYWKNHEIKGETEYAILTDIIHQEWSEVSVKAHKEIKGLKTQNLRDHMNEAELIFTALAELSTRQIAQTVAATGMEENAQAGQKGGRIAKRARRELEQKTGQSVVTDDNFLPPAQKPKKLHKNAKT